MKTSLCLAGLMAVLAVPAGAQMSLTGQVDFGSRYQLEDGLYAGQSGSGAGFFFGATLDATMGLGAGEAALTFSALYDDRDGRTGINLSRAYYTQSFGNWDILAGYNIDTWGVVESRSVLNVLNPVDNTDVVFGQQRLGTPMLNANLTTGIGTFSAYALLGFVQPNFAEFDSRLRAPWVTDPDRAIYQEGDGRHTDFALRWSHNIGVGDGGLDLAVSYFDGTDRTPLSLPGCTRPGGAITAANCDAINAAVLAAYNSGIPSAGSSADDIWDLIAPNPTDATIAALSADPNAGLVPYYQHIRQAGLSAVYASGDLQLRFEGAVRQARGEDASFAAVIGGDYTWHGLINGDDTLTVALEYLYDDRDIRQPGTLFENDIFLGLNFSLGDRRDTRVTAGGFYDLDSHAQLYQFTVSSRINDRLRAEVSAFHTVADGWTDPLSFIGNDSFLELKLSAYF